MSSNVTHMKCVEIVISDMGIWDTDQMQIKSIEKAVMVDQLKNKLTSETQAEKSAYGTLNE